jgi:serine phosphatase RsbU (regulator of sigma subunit)
VGTLLGALADVTLVDGDVELAPGDALVLYTDGVTEARAESAEFGQDRLVAVVSQLAERSAPAHELAAAIEAAVADFEDGHHPDDLALVVIQRN